MRTAYEVAKKLHALVDSTLNEFKWDGTSLQIEHPMTREAFVLDTRKKADTLLREATVGDEVPQLQEDVRTLLMLLEAYKPDLHRDDAIQVGMIRNRLEAARRAETSR